MSVLIPCGLFPLSFNLIFFSFLFTTHLTSVLPTDLARLGHLSLSLVLSLVPTNPRFSHDQQVQDPKPLPLDSSPLTAPEVKPSSHGRNGREGRTHRSQGPGQEQR